MTLAWKNFGDSSKICLSNPFKFFIHFFCPFVHLFPGIMWRNSLKTISRRRERVATTSRFGTREVVPPLVCIHSSRMRPLKLWVCPYVNRWVQESCRHFHPKAHEKALFQQFPQQVIFVWKMLNVHFKKKITLEKPPASGVLERPLFWTRHWSAAQLLSGLDALQASLPGSQHAIAQWALGARRPEALEGLKDSKRGTPRLL